jgi:CHASE2 domain
MPRARRLDNLQANLRCEVTHSLWRGQRVIRSRRPGCLWRGARLDVFGIDATFTMVLGNAAFENDINPNLLLIALQPGEDEGAKLRPARRADFARMLSALSPAQAKTIVFDVYLGASHFDTTLGDSILAARAAGHNVVFGFTDIAARDGAGRAELFAHTLVPLALRRRVRMDCGVAR